MKNIPSLRSLTIVLLLIVTSCTTTDLVRIPAKGFLVVERPQDGSNAVQISTRGSNSIVVAALREGEVTGGFGLGVFASEVMSIKNNEVLRLTNSANSQRNVRLEWITIDAPSIISTSTTTVTTSAEQSKRYVSLKLTNESSKKIPLIIPGVMNPNLSPRSESGVRLKIGQEVLFRYKMKTRVLFTVDETFKDGDVIEISSLLKAKKKELDEE